MIIFFYFLIKKYSQMSKNENEHVRNKTRHLGKWIYDSVLLKELMDGFWAICRRRFTHCFGGSKGKRDSPWIYS